MAMYCIGDIQGCNEAFDDLLQQLDYSPSRDVLYILGDMVNRGPGSAAVLRRLMALEGSAHCLLGNHDIHLLAVAQGVRPMHRKDTLVDLLLASDAQALLDWLRCQPLAMYANNCLMVHAGVQPEWDVAQTLACAQEVQQLLSASDWADVLPMLFGNAPERWRNNLFGIDRYRCTINTLTRIRLLDAQGNMDFQHKHGLENAPDNLMPWFEHPARKTANTLVAFGHWSTLGLVQQHNLLGLDTGCVWGGKLTAAEITPEGQAGRIVQVQSKTQVPLL